MSSRLEDALQALAAGTLRLVPLCADHAPALFEVLADPSLYVHLDDGPPASMQALRERYERLESRRSPDGREHWLNWAIEPEGLPAVGYVQATVLPDGTAWLAFVLGSAHGRRGIATRAAAAVLNHLRASYGVVRCLAMVEAANARSIALLQRLGFRPASPDEAAGHRLSDTERLFVHLPAEPPR